MRAPVLFLARAGHAQSCTGLHRLLSSIESYSGKNLRRRSIPTRVGRSALCEPRASHCGVHPPRVRVSNSGVSDRTRRRAVVLPGRLHDPRNLTAQCQSAEAQPAKAELAQVSARASAQLATIVLTRRELGLLVVLGDAGCSGHRFLYLSHPKVPLYYFVCSFRLQPSSRRLRRRWKAGT